MKPNPDTHHVVIWGLVQSLPIGVFVSHELVNTGLLGANRDTQMCGIYLFFHGKYIWVTCMWKSNSVVQYLVLVCNLFLWLILRRIFTFLLQLWWLQLCICSSWRLWSFILVDVITGKNTSPAIQGSCPPVLPLLADSNDVPFLKAKFYWFIRDVGVSPYI